MQQKYLWAGAVLLVAAAAGVYMASNYVLRHPDSVVAQAAGALGNAAIQSNPLSVIHRAATGTEVARSQGEVNDVEITKPIGGVEEESVEPIQIEGTQPEQQPQGSVDEGIWAPANSLRQLAEDWANRDDDNAPRPMPYAEVDPNDPVESLIDICARTIVETVMEGHKMCDAEEVKKREKAALIAKLMELFKRLMEQHKFQEACSIADRLCEIAPDSGCSQAAREWSRRALCDTERSGCFINRFEASQFWSDSEECEHPSTGGWLSDVQRMMEEYFHPELIDEMPEPQTEEPLPQQTEEPRYYHHHEEGCPYMNGRCWQQQSLPQAPVVIPEPTTKPAVKKPSYYDRLLQRTSERRWFTTPFTDTMEFRPSDAGRYPMTHTEPF
jgi:hypothetical protein